MSDDQPRQPNLPFLCPICTALKMPASWQQSMEEFYLHLGEHHSQFVQRVRIKHGYILWCWCGDECHDDTMTALWRHWRKQKDLARHLAEAMLIKAGESR